MGVVAPRIPAGGRRPRLKARRALVAPGKIGGVAMTEHEYCRNDRAFAQAAADAKALDLMRRDHGGMGI